MSGTLEVVYYVAPLDTNLVKIGVAAELPSRLRGIQTMSPVPLSLLAVEPGNVDLERERHRQFAAFRQHGEWFMYREPLRRHVTSLLDLQSIGLNEALDIGRRALSNAYCGISGEATRREWASVEQRYFRALHRRERDSLRRFFGPRIKHAQTEIARKSVDGLIEREDLSRALRTNGPKLKQLVDVGSLHMVHDPAFPSRIYYAVEDVMALLDVPRPAAGVVR